MQFLRDCRQWFHLPWFYIGKLSDWLPRSRHFVPLIRSNTKTNHDSLGHVFPRFLPESSTGAFTSSFDWLTGKPVSFVTGQIENSGVSVKALVNDETLLRTHCCPWCFLGCANWETFVAGHKMFLNKIRNTKFVSATNVARAGKRGNICVGNNVSSFARVFTRRKWNAF